MKTLFIQKGTSTFLGSMIISAVLEKAGIKTDLLIVDKEKDLINKIKEINPDYILISCMTDNYFELKEVASEIKREINIKIIIGGVHATFYPKLIDYDLFDIACIGECEKVIVDIIKGKNLDRISNICYKQNNKIKRNEIGKLVENLDKIPFPNRDLYKRYPDIKKRAAFMAGRGCPYQCTYCFNHQYQKICQSKGKYVRFRSPKNVIKEIKDVVKKLELKTIIFTDDAFLLDKRWLKEFLNMYKKEINLPFICDIRIDNLDERTAKLMKSANCHAVKFAIESGNEEIRKKILNKTISDEQIINGARLLHKHGIKYMTFNMLGIPDETIDDAIETIMLNAKIKPDVVWCALLRPYPKTEIAKYAIKKGYLEEGEFHNYSYHKKSDLKMKDIEQINNLHKLFWVGVKFPFMIKTIRSIIKFKSNPIFNGVFYMGYAYRYFKLYRPSFKKVIRLALENKNILRSN